MPCPDGEVRADHGLEGSMAGGRPGVMERTSGRSRLLPSRRPRRVRYGGPIQPDTPVAALRKDHRPRKSGMIWA